MNWRTLTFTQSQAETIADYLGSDWIITCSISQAEPYGDIRIKRSGDLGMEHTLISPRGEWLGNVEPPQCTRIA